jgi:mannosyltransferase
VQVGVGAGGHFDHVTVVSSVHRRLDGAIVTSRWSGLADGQDFNKLPLVKRCFAVLRPARGHSGAIRALVQSFVALWILPQSRDLTCAASPRPGQQKKTNQSRNTTQAQGEADAGVNAKALHLRTSRCAGHLVLTLMIIHSESVLIKPFLLQRGIDAADPLCFPLPLALLNVTMPLMTYRRALLLMTCVTLLGFGVRVISIDAQSMWRDEIDTLCYALDFWNVLQHAGGRGQMTNPNSPQALPSEPGLNITPQGESGTNGGHFRSSTRRVQCGSTPGLSRLDPTKGLLATLRALLTLPGWNGPLYTVAMRPWIGLTGDSPFAVRSSSLFFGALAMPLTYVLGRRLLGTLVGMVGALLVALSPHLVWYSQEAKMYGPILALGLLAIYALRRALDQTTKVSGEPKVSQSFGSLIWWTVMVGATMLAVYTHILAALLVPLEAVLGLIWWPRTRQHWRGALIALGCLTLPYLPLLAWQAHSWFLPAGQATLFTIGRLDVMLEATFNGWGSNFLGEPWMTLILGALALLALFGLTRVRLLGEWAEIATEDRGRNKGEPMYDWRNLAALLAWMLLPLLGIWLMSVRQPIFTNRYLIWAAPALYLLTAAGFVALARFGRSGALVATGLLLVILVGDGRALLHQATQAIKPDFRAAAAYIEERYQPGDLIIFHLSYMETNFDYYYEGEFEGWGAPAAGSGLSQTDIDWDMRTNTSGHDTVWLILSEAQMWDPQGLVKAWMDAHATVPPDEHVFAYVSVYRYILGE